MKIKVVVEQGEDGYFVAHCPSLKSCWSQGKTEEEALSNIRQAIELYSISMPKLEEEDREIKKRMHEIQSDKVKTLTREETFKGIL